MGDEEQAARRGRDKEEEKLDEEDENEWIPPTLRFVGYDPKSGHKSLLVVPPQAVVEVVAEHDCAELLARNQRTNLTKFLARQLHLEFPRNAPPELVLPWSGANVGYIGRVDPAKKMNQMRPMEERMLKREGRVLRTSMVLTNLHVLVSAF